MSDFIRLALLLAILTLVVYLLREFFGQEPLVYKYPGLIIAMSAGLFGATFSMLIQIQQRTSVGTLDDVEIAASWHTLAVRCSFGIGAASILYFFFESGLLGGELWPNLEELAFTGDVVPNKNWSLLVIWSFIAGFSENFVPKMLMNTERRSETP